VNVHIILNRPAQNAQKRQERPAPDIRGPAAFGAR
jgi:hypothetical protein